MLAFVEDRLDMGYDYGAVGGPVFSTDLVVFGSGYELRNANWSIGHGRWQLGERNILQAKLQELLAFFRARRGRAQGFRYKDWTDYAATDEALAPDGGPTLQLTKTYASATSSENEVRPIQKPVDGTVTMHRAGAAFAAFTIDATTGIATLAADWTAAIGGITQANPAVVNVAGHGRSTGDVLYLSAISGMAELNGAAYTITVIDADHFSLDGIDSTAYSAYTSGGTASMYVQPSESLTWSGEFDVAARFDADQIQVKFVAYDDAQGGIYYLTSLPVQEILL